MKIKLTISYDGTNYCGWQKQKNGISVQEVIENALSSLVGEQIKIIGSGRTDAGVHAEGQVASFSTKKENIPPEKYAFALNSILPPDIKILDSKLFRDNYGISKFYDEYDTRIIRECMVIDSREKMMEKITGFYNYVMEISGGFDINKFVLRSEVK